MNSGNQRQRIQVDHWRTGEDGDSRRDDQIQHPEEIPCDGPLDRISSPTRHGKPHERRERACHEIAESGRNRERRRHNLAPIAVLGACRKFLRRNAVRPARRVRLTRTGSQRAAGTPVRAGRGASRQRRP